MCKLPFANWTAFDTRIENTQTCSRCLFALGWKRIPFTERNIKRQIKVRNAIRTAPLRKRKLTSGHFRRPKFWRRCCPQMEFFSILHQHGWSICLSDPLPVFRLIIVCGTCSLQEAKIDHRKIWLIRAKTRNNHGNPRGGEVYSRRDGSIADTGIYIGWYLSHCTWRDTNANAFIPTYCRVSPLCSGSYWMSSWQVIFQWALVPA